MPHTTPRVVSLIASATEIVWALGRGALQVARSHECDFPPAVLGLPALTAPKFKVRAPAAISMPGCGPSFVTASPSTASMRRRSAPSTPT